MSIKISSDKKRVFPGRGMYSWTKFLVESYQYLMHLEFTEHIFGNEFSGTGQFKLRGIANTQDFYFN